MTPHHTRHCLDHLRHRLCVVPILTLIIILSSRMASERLQHGASSAAVLSTQYRSGRKSEGRSMERFQKNNQISQAQSASEAESRSTSCKSLCLKLNNLVDCFCSRMGSTASLVPRVSCTAEEHPVIHCVSGSVRGSLTMYLNR